MKGHIKCFNMNENEKLEHKYELFNMNENNFTCKCSPFI